MSDVTAFVRQHCLQLWTSLVQQKKVPVRQYIRAFELGLDRLRDSACAVRKDAVTLVMNMVLNNPYFVVVSLINDLRIFDGEFSFSRRIQHVLNSKNDKMMLKAN